MPDASATQVMDELIRELADGSGPRERVIQEYFGSIEHPARCDGIHETADAAVQELRCSWGPTATPDWVDGIVPGRGQHASESEFDCYFAVFHRDGFWGYVRMRAPRETDTPEDAYLRLLLGVVRDSRPNNSLKPSR
jgi:hypothetical protein